MNTIQKRFLAFLLLCIPVRIGFVFIAKKVDIKYLPYLGYLAILPAIGFAYIYIFGKRKTGGETFGQKIWWNNLRPLHSILYFIFAYLALKKSNNAYIPFGRHDIYRLSANDTFTYSLNAEAAGFQIYGQYTEFKGYLIG